MRTIHIDLMNPASIQSAIENIKTVRDRVDGSEALISERLAEMGAETARSHYGSMASVSVEADGSKATICAEGKAVVFAEFGAGMTTASGHPFAGNVPLNISPGSYSRTEGSGEFWKKYSASGFGSWHFGGKVYTNVYPRFGLMYAMHEIQNNAVDVMKGVLGL